MQIILTLGIIAGEGQIETEGFKSVVKKLNFNKREDGIYTVSQDVVIIT